MSLGSRFEQIKACEDGLATSAGADGHATYSYDPTTAEAYRGGPAIAYRSEASSR